MAIEGLQEGSLGDGMLYVLTVLCPYPGYDTVPWFSTIERKTGGRYVG